MFEGWLFSEQESALIGKEEVEKYGGEVFRLLSSITKGEANTVVRSVAIGQNLTISAPSAHIAPQSVWDHTRLNTFRALIPVFSTIIATQLL